MRALPYEKLIAVLNISGFGMKQLVGHLDFFPNGGEEMPGCKKNALSQIVDIDGIWAGKARAEWGHHFPGGATPLPQQILTTKTHCSLKIYNLPF